MKMDILLCIHLFMIYPYTTFSMFLKPVKILSLFIVLLVIIMSFLNFILGIY
jgi:hypothetical protein